MAPRLGRERRRARLLDRLETAAFWICVTTGLGLIWLLVGLVSSP
jgi:hypothetical protein